MESLLPTIVSLKHVLVQSQSPLLRYLMVYLCEIVKDFDEDVKEVRVHLCSVV